MGSADYKSIGPEATLDVAVALALGRVTGGYPTRSLGQTLAVQRRIWRRTTGRVSAVKLIKTAKVTAIAGTVAGVVFAGANPALAIDYDVAHPHHADPSYCYEQQDWMDAQIIQFELKQLPNVADKVRTCSDYWQTSTLASRQRTWDARFRSLTDDLDWDTTANKVCDNTGGRGPSSWRAPSSEVPAS